MNSVEINREKSVIFTELKTDYLYIAIPFLLLIAIKLYMGEWRDVILSTDWSLASCLIFGQSASKLSRAAVASKNMIVEQNFGWYTAKRFLLIVASLAVYFGMIAKPSLSLAFSQIFLFLIASFFHFKDGFAALLIIRNKQ
ncbi:hypothetical protein [Aquitalea aquatica]|uniref:Uncharacterized protein n=1 Tax=Aquitalea aquatica TaxID=3044273 RepID=A0A838YAY7_9NEIS|nr:hypothetical protein [Aquitalea magnusonii]MBA4707934.1 hypothetical protein [Aquitalea magnusonii]